MEELVDAGTHTVQLVIFKVNDEVLAAKIISIREVVKLETITPVPSSHEYIAGIVNIRGKVIPVMDLGAVLKISTHDLHRNYILLANAPDNSLVGMAVNEVIAIKHFSEEEIKPAPKLVESKIAEEFIEGVVLPKTSNGIDSQDVILLIDLESIINGSVADVLEQVRAEQDASIIKEKA
jgi:purine-binding chemotaxis protein CheW